MSKEKKVDGMRAVFIMSKALNVAYKSIKNYEPSDAKDMMWLIENQFPLGLVEDEATEELFSGKALSKQLIEQTIRDILREKHNNPTCDFKYKTIVAGLEDAALHLFSTGEAHTMRYKIIQTALKQYTTTEV